MNAPAPGWNPDPSGRHEYRYWDGGSWTDDVSDDGVTSVDPVAGGAGRSGRRRRPDRRWAPSTHAGLAPPARRRPPGRRRLRPVRQRAGPPAKAPARAPTTGLDRPARRRGPWPDRRPGLHPHHAVATTTATTARPRASPRPGPPSPTARGRRPPASATPATSATWARTARTSAPTASSSSSPAADQLEADGSHPRAGRVLRRAMIDGLEGRSRLAASGEDLFLALGRGPGRHHHGRHRLRITDVWPRSAWRSRRVARRPLIAAPGPPTATAPETHVADARGHGPTAGADPVLVRRRRMARAAELGQRVGYALFGLAVVVFVVGFAAGFTRAWSAPSSSALGVGSLLLAPAIVVGYAVKAADRDDRERSSGSLTRRPGSRHVTSLDCYREVTLSTGVTSGRRRREPRP